MSSPTDYPAGNLTSRISGGLRCEVIWATVYHNGFADDIIHAKPACQYLSVCSAIDVEQRWQIPRVVWMVCAAGVIMTACVGKTITPTVISFMDMESKETSFRIGQAVNIRDHKRTSAAGEKMDCSV